MSFQTPLTINEVIAKIHTKKYLLPSIQREFVWDTNQIIMLFFVFSLSALYAISRNPI